MKTNSNIRSLLQKSGKAYKPALAATCLVGLLSMSPVANADIFSDGVNWVEDTATDGAEWVEDTAVDTWEVTEDLVSHAVNEVESGLEDAAAFIEDLAMDGYRAAAEAMFDQWINPMTSMATAWKKLAAEDSQKMEALFLAIKNQDGPATIIALENIMDSMAHYAGFDALVQDFKDRGAGSLLLFGSVGGGMGGVSGEFDGGVALDIDFVIDIVNHVATGNKREFYGPIASYFIAGGIQIGPAAGGGSDFVVGYHVANPDGVYGPGLDFSLEGKAKVGGSAGIGWDLSQVPPQIVTAGVGLGAGVEIKAAVGPSYATVLAQLCSDGSLKEFAADCDDAPVEKSSYKGVTDVDEEWLSIRESDANVKNPVVFLSAPTFNGSDAGVIRVKNITNAGFDMHFQEWDYLDGIHTNESVEYLVLPEGHSGLMEVGTFEISDTKDWKNIEFTQPFTSAPYVFLMIQTYNGAQAVAVRAKDITTTGFKAAMFEQEALIDGHTTEVIGYMAVTASPLFQLFNGISQPISVDLNDSGVMTSAGTYYLQEEQSFDSETTHGNETIHMFKFFGIDLVQQVTSNGGDTTSIRRELAD